MTGFRRKGNCPQPLSADEVERIHTGALEILAETGMVVRDGELVQRLQEAGCPADPGQGRVKIPPGLVEEALRRAPHVVTLCGRSSELDMQLGDGRVYGRTPGGATRILDLETGSVRESTRADAVELVRLADALPNIHGISMCQVVPMDAPRDRVDLTMAQLSLANTGKHLFYVCHNDDLVEAVIEMAASQVGGYDALRERPIVSPLCESTSPLRLVESQAKVLKSFAGRGLPLRLHAHPIAGFTSPVTLAGELVVTHAEVLGLVVIAQLVAPHLPVVYGMSSSVPDMKTGLNLAGAVEIGLLGAAVAQLAGRIGIPCSVSSGIDADLPGAQAILERMMTALPPILAGADLINLCPVDSKLTFSAEQLVMDDEVMRWVGYYLRGMSVDEESLALGLIHSVGPGGTFVGKAHTARHLRQSLLLEGLIRGRSTDPAADLTSRARQKAREILQQSRPDQ